MSSRIDKTTEGVIASLHDVADEMHTKMVKGIAPTMTLPVRTKKNIEFDKKLGVFKYGKKRSIRDATSLRSANQLLRALHIIEFIEEMINKGKLAIVGAEYNLETGKVEFLETL